MLRGDGSTSLSTVLDLIDVLGRSLSLPCYSSVDVALALDWYKVPEEEVDPRNWRNTELGDLVHRGKYWYREPSQSSLQRVVARAVVARAHAA